MHLLSYGLKNLELFMINNRYSYKNGNYIVYYSYGRLVKRACRFGEELISDFPDSIDLKISNKCSWGCPYCHESSFPEGDVLDIDKTMEVLSQLPEVPIEIAIGGGNVFETPSLTLELIQRLKKREYLPRITINYKDLLSPLTEEKKLILDEVGGIGISLDHLPEVINDFLGEPSLYETLFGSIDTNVGFITRNYNIVAHIIAGVFPISQLQKLFDISDIPILILGYKQWGRAKGTELPESMKEFEQIVKQEIYKQRTARYEDFISRKVVGFDNLALEQLDIKSCLSDKEWDSLYMGDEGSHSMYIDAVKGQFARTSRSAERVDWNSIGLLDYFKSL